MRYKKKKPNKNWECKIEVRGLKRFKKRANKENGNNKKEGKKRSGMKTISGKENLKKKQK